MRANGKMLSRDRCANRFACGCCQEYAYNSKGLKQARRVSRHREEQAFRKDLRNQNY